MDSLTFRPSLEGMEDRTVPSVSPAAATAAYVDTMNTADYLLDLTATLGRPRTTQTIQFLAARLPQFADQSRADAATLAGYLADLQGQIAANPALAGVLNPIAGGVGAAAYQATINAAYADLYGLGFGAPPRVPPPPPPFAPTDPNFGTDASSTLPFSLDDPAFQAQPDGVKIWNVVQGTGTTVQTGDAVTVNYIGYLTIGSVFDSSFNSGQPLKTTLSTANLIPGFVEGVAGMQVGGVRRVFIPAALAYGGQTRPGIPANSDLVFEITLVSSP
jgi:hypothetical protein